MRPVSVVKIDQFDVLLRNIIRLKIKRKRNQIFNEHRELLKRGFRECKYFTSPIMDPFERPYWKKEERTHLENGLYKEIIFGLLSALEIRHKIVRDEIGRVYVRIRGTNIKLKINICHSWFIEDSCSLFTHSPVWTPEIGNGQWEGIVVNNNIDRAVGAITHLLKSDSEFYLIVLKALLRRMKPEQLVQANIIRSKISHLKEEEEL